LQNIPYAGEFINISVLKMASFLKKKTKPGFHVECYAINETKAL